MHRNVEPAFQPAGSGDFPGPSALRTGKSAEPADRNVCATGAKFMVSMRGHENVEAFHEPALR